MASLGSLSLVVRVEPPIVRVGQGLLRLAALVPSGSTMTLAIAHEARPDDRVIIDAVREMRPPFSPTAVVDEFAALLKAYDVTKVVGDHYGFSCLAPQKKSRR